MYRGPAPLELVRGLMMKLYVCTGAPPELLRGRGLHGVGGGVYIPPDLRNGKKPENLVWLSGLCPVLVLNPNS